MKISLFKLTEFFFSCLLTIIFPLFFNNYLNAEASYLNIIIFTLGINFLFAAKKYCSFKAKRNSRVFLYIILIATALLLYINIIVIPPPAYGAWFMELSRQSNGGSIACLFVYGSLYFSVCISGLVFTHGYLRPISGLIFINSLILLILFQNNYFLVIALLCTLGTIAIFIITTWKKYSRILLSSLLLLVLIMLLSLGFTIMSKTDKELIFYFYVPENIKTFLVHNLPEKSFLDSSLRYGFSFNSQKLGEKPLLQNKTSFKIEGDFEDPLYLRAQVFDKYHDNSWQNSFKKKIVSNIKNSKYFSVDTGHYLTKGITTEKNIIKLTCLLEYFPLIPHTLSTKTIIMEEKKFFKLLSADFNTGFTLLTPLLYKDTVIINREKDITKKVNIDRSFLNMIEKRINRKIRIQYYDDPKIDLKKYLNVPGNLPLTVKKLALSLSKKNDPEWKKLLNIYQYLRKNYHYTLETVAPAPKQDFIENFLFIKKKGHSEHYASSFVILARLNKIPARYVTGFLLPPAKGTTQIISGLNAHAWAEVYLTGLGWTLIETTPFADIKNYTEYIKNNDRLTAAQLSALTGKKITKKEILEKPKININKEKLLFAIILVIIIIFVLYLSYYIYKKWKNRSHLKGKKRIIQKIARKMTRYACKRKITHPDKIGWIKWGDLLKSIFSDNKSEIDKIIFIINKTFFSKKLPTKDELYFLKKFFKKITR